MNFNDLDKLAHGRLLVAGEVGIDEYLWGDTRRISPEAPVPVVEVESTTQKLGLSANVAQNIASLGAEVELVTVCGQDSDGERLRQMLRDAGIAKLDAIIDETRPTLRKVRVIAQKQHVVRVDYERSHQLEPKHAKRFIESISDRVSGVDGIIIQDYGKGIWNSDTMGFLQHSRAHKKPVFVDPSRNSALGLYRGTTLMTPNLVEAEVLTRTPPAASKTAGREDTRLAAMAARMLAETDGEHAIITCGEWGMVSLSRGEREMRRIPTFAREVFDVTGAGDTVIALLSLAYVCGFSLAECMQIANAAAGLVVGQIGAASVSLPQLKDELDRLHQVGLIKGN